MTQPEHTQEGNSRRLVTFILTQSLECPSGVGRYWPLAQGLVKHGYRVRVLALHPDYAALKKHRFTRDGVEVWYVAQMHVQKKDSRKLYFGPGRLLWVAARAALGLTWAAISTRSDIYHLGKPQPINGIAALCLLALGRRVYLDCDDLEAASNLFAADWQQRLVAWFEDHLPSLAQGVTVNTTFLQKRVEGLITEGRHVVLVPNAVSASRFDMPGTDEIAAIRELHRLEDRPVVSYIGSMNLVNHPVDLLLEGFALFTVKEIPEAVLMLVGGGADLDLLMSRAQELGIAQSVRFVGHVPSDKVPAYYAASDLSVDPVLDDIVALARSPLKLYEALAVGTPVVTSDVGDRYQVLGENESFLVPPGDARALGKRLSALLKDLAAREALRSWALSNRELFTWESRIEEFLQVYEQT